LVRAVAGLGLCWLVLHLLGVGLSPGNLGQMPAWSRPEHWLGALPASIWRVISLLGLAVFLGWWAKRPSQPSNVGQLARVAGAGCAGFVLLHAWHLRAYLSVAATSPQARAYAVADHLAATLSATRWGVPWLALGYLIGIFSVGILLGCELWLAAQLSRARPRWRRQRSYALLSVAAAAISIALMLRALLYFATGSDPIG